MPARALGKPVADQLGFVGAVIVHDDVDVEVGRNVAFDLVEESAEFFAPFSAAGVRVNDIGVRSGDRAARFERNPPSNTPLSRSAGGELARELARKIVAVPSVGMHDS